MSHSPVTCSVDADGIGWITFGVGGGRATVFNPATQLALRTALIELAGQPVRAVVLISAHDRIFVAGADLRWLATLPDGTTATQVARDGQELFKLVAEFKVPVISAIHGACAGGGYELALACAWRIASDATETVIGLPEVGLGLIPGWGGCTRLPLLIGLQPAVEHMLDAALVPAVMAHGAGLIDELVPAAELRQRARAAALRLAEDGIPVRSPAPSAVAGFIAEQRRLVVEQRRGEAAPLALLDAVEKSAHLPLADALRIEAAHFGKLAASETAKNLIAVFLLRDAAKKNSLDGWFPASSETVAGERFRTIGIVGAGVMGAGITHWCAAQGYGIILCDADRSAINRAVSVVRDLFAEAVRRGQLSAEVAHKMTGGIGITTSLEDFDICDLVIETISEDLEAKQKLFAELSGIVRPGCVLVTNTSALSVDEIAGAAADPGLVAGLQFFNPVSRTPVVELVLATATTRRTAERVLAFAKSLGKTVVIGRAQAGFFASRVLFFYLNEACRLWEQGVSTQEIDDAMRDWGWRMGPMRLIDEVGLDVTEAIYGRLVRCFPGRFSQTEICRRLLAEGWNGRKNGISQGFYEYTDGVETLNSGTGKFSKSTHTITAAEIQERLTGAFLEEARRALAEGVVKTADAADLVLILGAGFPAFRGGPLRQLQSGG